MIQKALFDISRLELLSNNRTRFRWTLLTALLAVWSIGGTHTLLAHDMPLHTAVADTTLKVQICDNETYEFAGHILDTAGVYTVVYEAFDGTDSTVTLILSVLPVPVTNLVAGICEGTEYVFQGDTLKTSGTYSDTLTAANGCDSIIILKLDVAAFFDTQLDVTICEGESFPFAGILIDESGVYVDSLTALGGCDSTVTLTLVVLPPVETTLEAAICAGGFYAIGGDTLTLEGIYTGVFEAATGCDSIVTLTLHVFPVENTSIEGVICTGETFVFGGDTLSVAGTYTDSLTTVNGCDSIVTLQLQVLPTSTSAIAATICDGEFYELNGQILTTSGVFASVVNNEVGCDSTITLTLTVLPLSADTVEASICTGQTYLFNGTELNTEGEYTAVVSGANSCDSTITLILNVTAVLETALEATVCFGETYTFEGQNLTESGIYTETLASTGGCDSIITLTLTVLPEQQAAIEATICANETYVFDGNELTESGEFTAVFTDINGCDSIVTLTLTVLPVSASSSAVTICGNGAYPFYGTILTETGEYTAVIPSANGCDSTITLQLTVLPVSNTDVQATICFGETYDYFGETLAETGTYNYTYEAANGCDSLVNLTLIVLPENTTTLDLSLCTGSSYVLDGDTLTTDGTYTAVMTDANGCDSTVVVTLTFLNAFQSETLATICSGQSYTFQGENYTQSGTFSVTLTATGGCDSIVTLVLTVLPAYELISAVTICSNESYTFDGNELSVTGVYTAAFVTAAGCDSIVTLELTVLPVAASQVNATICAGGFYPFNGQALSASGVYTSVVPAANGCDSTITLNLTVAPSYHEELNATICANESYTFGGETLVSSGTYTQQLSTAAGCDSVIILHLTVNPVYEQTQTVVSCFGQPYVYNNTPLSQSGTYAFTFPSVAGCDSVVTIQLTIVPPVPPTNLAASICEGEVYLFNGQILASPGIYSATLPNEYGCDSVVILNLTVTSINTGVVLNGITLTALATNATYQWINCATQQPVTGANGASFTPAVTGSYAVQITSNGCTSLTGCTNVTVVSTYEGELAVDWQIQPNPATATVFVQLDTPAGDDLTVSVFDLSGRRMMLQTIPAGSTSERLDIAGLPAGMYMIKLSDSNGSAVKRLMKGRE